MSDFDGEQYFDILFAKAISLASYNVFHFFIATHFAQYRSIP